MTASPMYCGEISSDDCRGAIGSFMQLFIVRKYLYDKSNKISYKNEFQLEFCSFMLLDHMYHMSLCNGFA